MKNHINFVKNLQFVISIALIFVLSANSLIAQNQTYEYMVNRLDEIDHEMNKLTLLKQSIGMDFKEISDFSVQARPLLVKYRNYQELIKQREEERSQPAPSYEVYKKRIKKINSEIELLIKLRDEEDLSYKKSGGLYAPTEVWCNSLKELDKEYLATTDSFLKKKIEYDKIKKELGKLNTEKHDLETKLKYGGDQSIGALDPCGCWVLAFGNHISEITIKKHKSGKFVGTLTVNNLQDYEDGQTVLILERVSDNTFRGTEYTWEAKPNGKIGKATIPAMITINTDNNYITWTSDQTVTMRRCR